LKWSYQPGREIRKFPQDAILASIGTIAPKKAFGKSKLFISLKFSGHGVVQVPAELIPMLVESSTYENKVRYQHAQASHQWSVVESPHKLSISNIDGGVYFVFPSEKNNVIVPAIELARVLFLNNFHLTRTAFRPNGLQSLATVERLGENAEIRFNRLSDYPLSNLTSQTALKHLVWLLLSEDNRRSFNSIYQKFIECSDQNWHFDFEPPDLTLWKFSAKGYFEGDDFFVNEINEMHSNKIDGLPDIHIYHPNKKEPIFIDKLTEGGSKPPRMTISGKPDALDFKSGVNPKRKHSIFKSDELKQRIHLQTNIAVQAGTISPRRKPKIDIDDALPANTTGLNQGKGNGDAKEFDYQVNTGSEDDITLTEANCSDRLEVMRSVINQMVAMYGHIKVLEINTYKCPNPNKAVRGYYYDGTQEPRVFLWGQLLVGEREIHILEVDNSGENTKKISTPVIEFGLGITACAAVKKIMQAYVDAGMKWDTSVITTNASSAKYINHPAGKFETGDEAHINRWLGYFTKQFREMGLISDQASTSTN
tara:strand:+ start:16130 stop:17740 length:1611 start_codon:yes stop_codon:yes gene_type:complete